MTSASASQPAIATTWPAGFAAGRAAVGGFAVREVAAPADAVFAWIRRIDLHPEFYPALHKVWKVGGPWPVIGKGTSLGFLVGTTLIPYLQIQAVDAEARTLAWGGDLPGLSICHGWTVKPLDEHRSLVRSEELWGGPIAKLSAPLSRGPIQKVQTEWVEAVARAASRHPEGPPAA